ncbi:Mini-ribonuclease 3 [Helicovermis profundi]|uniref:Mini-ribonuclease 3 n=1 Tax=Helicovermis profundi TaxID=3065157 RepID=A0AAU9EPS1_9FIRM|nr:ribonuclease III domain-containing protein [Clostridia bacterium S502]
MEEFIKKINILNVSENDLKMMNPLVLAYIGDSIFDLFIKSYMVSKSKANVNKINKMVVKFVKAPSQALIVKRITEFLSEEEIRIIKRGRNQKTTTPAKNASLVDYKLATGFEALIGWLYLKDDISRLNQIIELSIKIIEESEELI